MQWQFHADAPIYAQLVEGITRRIVAGTYPPGSRLPSVRDLAAEAGVNPNTMQRAMSEMERQGLLHSQRTAGRFVTEDEAVIRALREELAREEVRSFLAGMLQLGFRREEISTLLEKEGEIL